MRKKIWLGVGLAVAVAPAAPAASLPDLGAAMPAALVASAHRALIWHVADAAKAGGEGGEQGSAAVMDKVTGETIFFSNLLETRAMLRLSRDLAKAGDGKAASERLQHAIDEIYPKLAAGLAERQFAPFDDKLNELAKLAPKDSAAFLRKLPALESDLEAVRPRGLTLPGVKEMVSALAIAKVVQHAAVEYGEAVTDGKIGNLPEYQYTNAFLSVVHDLLDTAKPALAARHQPATDAIAADLAILQAFVPGLTPPAAPLATPGEFSTVASRIELKASRFMQ